MKEYYTLSIEETSQETEDKLNNLAEDGWKLICSYALAGQHLIMERDKKEEIKSNINNILEKVKRIVRDDYDEDEIIREINKLKEIKK